MFVKKRMIFLVLSIILVVAGCGQVEMGDENYSEAEEADSLTIEYLCENYGMKEADFDGIDFDDFVNYYGLTKESIKREVPAVLLDRYKREKLGEGVPKYIQLDKTVDVFKTEYKDDVEVVIVESIDGSGATQCSKVSIIDFGYGHILSGSDLRFISEKNIVGDTNEQIKEEVLSYFDKYNIYNWDDKNTTAEIDYPDDASDKGVSNAVLTIKLGNGEVYKIGYDKNATDTQNKKDFFGFVSEIEKKAN